MPHGPRRIRRSGSLCCLAALTACAPLAGQPTGPGVRAASQSALVQPAAHYRLLHNFGKGDDGSAPADGLVLLDGTFYGTTQYGGYGGNGTVFSIAPSGSEKIVYSFGAKMGDGAQPVAGLINVGGLLYGTTEFGGTKNSGTVFSIDASGTETPLYSFSGMHDGTSPLGGLTAFKGVFYGTTSAGGAYGHGTVFSLTVKGTKVTKTIVHNFIGYSIDGATPQANLIVFQDVSGTTALYGTTTGGGTSGDGTIFTIPLTGSQSGVESVVASFNCSNGKTPDAGLTNLAGAFFGTTASGGNSCGSGQYGTVFTMSSGHALRAIHSFGTMTGDGQYPMAPLLDVKDTFFGTTNGGGGYGVGTIFSITAAGKERVLHNFGSQTDGARPLAGLLASGKAFYGTTSAGGRYGGGTVYTFSY